MNTNDPNFSWGVGQKIKHLRERLGLSQREIGNELGVTLQQIQKYEKGMNDPSLVGLAKICRALNVTPNELLDFDDPPSRPAAVREILGAEQSQRIGSAA